MLLYIYSQLRGNGCLYIKAEQHNVAIPHDVFLALGTYQEMCIRDSHHRGQGGRKGTARRKGQRGA